MNGVTIRGQLIMLLIETVVVFTIGFVLWKKKKTTIKRILHYYLIVVYAGFILAVTVLRRPLGSRERVLHLYIDFGIDGINEYLSWGIIITLLNVGLFVPWGIIIGHFFSGRSFIRRVAMTTLIGFLTSFLVECIQFATGTGFFELTDLVTNTFGAFLGALLIIYKK
jgi:glycopeptide antibiotics resistance protein